MFFGRVVLGGRESVVCVCLACFDDFPEFFFGDDGFSRFFFFFPYGKGRLFGESGK